MPLWYALALVLILGAAFEHRPISSGPGLFILLAAVLWAVIIVFTITMLVPLNNRIAKMDPVQPYDCWLRDRCRWDKLHQVRVILLVMAFLLLLTGLFAGAATTTI
jgi:NADH:ubiquinone oxidoreductase subunit 3 (subunit A)